MPVTESLTVRTLFAPWDDTTGEYLALVQSAEKEIVISIFGFHLPRLTDILVAKHQAGVRVSLILDHSQAEGKAESEEVKKLLAAGVPHLIGTSPMKHQILHAKMTIVDGRKVEHGSWNYSLSASAQLNDMHLVEGEAYAAYYLKQFERIRDWILLHEMAMQDSGTVPAVAPLEVQDSASPPLVAAASAATAPLTAVSATPSKAPVSARRSTTRQPPQRRSARVAAAAH